MAKHRDVILVLLITVLYHTMNQMFVPTFPIYIAERGGDEVLVGLLVGLIPLGSIVAKSFWENEHPAFESVGAPFGVDSSHPGHPFVLPLLGFGFSPGAPPSEHRLGRVRHGQPGAHG